MTVERWNRIDGLVQAALRQPDGAREAFVRNACADDADICREVLSLLAHAGPAEAFLEPAPPAPASAGMAHKAGARLGPYEILDAIGAGGMGEVYRARDTRLDRVVAVKILPHLHASPSLQARFEREARAIAALNHPNICTIHDVGRHDGVDFFVMEFIEGQTLRNRLRRGRLSIDEMVLYAGEIAQALAAAHRGGLVHRDIKPSNIMITTDGHVKVVDFGLARLASLFNSDDSTKSDTTEAGVIVGTPYYMSPEQARGLAVDQRTDIFSLGIVMYECLAGRLPFDADSRGDYLRQIVSGDPRPLVELRTDVPEGLRTLIARCLEKDASKRFDSASWLAAELAQLSGERVGTPAKPTQPGSWRPGWTVIAAGIGLSAFVGFAAWQSLKTPSATTTGSQLRRFTTSAGAESDSHLSPDGQWVSFVADVPGGRQLFVQEIEGTVRQPVKIPAGYLQSHLWSDDQNYFACLIWQKPGWTLQIVKAVFGSDTPANTWSLSDVPRYARLLRWTDGAIYLQVEDATRRSKLSLHRFDLTLGKSETLAGPWGVRRVEGFDVRPNSRQVVWTEPVGPDRDDLWLGDLDGGPATRLTPEDDRSLKRFPLWNSKKGTLVYQSNRGGQADLWEIDPATRKSVQITTDPGIEVPESISTDGSVSFRLTTEKAALWIWGARQEGIQVSDESLSDFSPTASLDGRLLAFQRSLPAPVEGFLTTDTDLFFAKPASPPARLAASKVATGLSPGLSPDGRVLAYLQRVPGASGMFRLKAIRLESRVIDDVSSTLPPPPTSDLPAAWTDQNFAWSTPEDLYFIDSSNQPGRLRLMHYRVGQTAEPVKGTESAARLANIYPSSSGRTLAYLSNTTEASSNRKTYQLHALDTANGGERVVHTFPHEESVNLRGWIRNDAALVVTKHSAINDADATFKVAVAIFSRDGTPQEEWTINQVLAPGMARLIGRQADLYVTRSVQGIHNLFALSLATGDLRQVSRNALLDVSFGTVEPLGADYVVGTRQEKTQNIHLLDARPRTAPVRSIPGR